MGSWAWLNRCKQAKRDVRHASVLPLCSVRNVLSCNSQIKNIISCLQDGQENIWKCNFQICSGWVKLIISACVWKMVHILVQSLHVCFYTCVSVYKCVSQLGVWWVQSGSGRVSLVLQSFSQSLPLAWLLCSASLKPPPLSGWSVLIRPQFNFPGCSTAL